MRRLAWRAVVGGLALMAATSAINGVDAAGAATGGDSLRTTFLLSRALDGGFANGPSRNGAVSHDQRIARLMAFESDASNIVTDDGNGLTDVYVVRRARPWGRNGTPWRIGVTELISRGPGGAPANGRSYGPALDGDSHHRPHCVAFVSEASNLVPGDTNGKADAFVHDLRTRRTRRVSVAASGRQSDGTTSEVAIDGACERAAFVSDATNLALRRTSRRGWRAARTHPPRPGTRQVYVRFIGGEGHDRGFRNLTFLASASRARRPGAADSHSVDFARSGRAVVFASEAPNLARGDGNGTTDVYRRTLGRRFEHLGHGRGSQNLVLATHLVSAVPGTGRAGNGTSTFPSVDDAGRFVAYETRATNLLPFDRNGFSDIVRADNSTRRPRQRWASRSAFSGVGNADSNRPVISGAGEFVLFDSDATNLKPSASVRDDVNGLRDLFLWNQRSGNVSLESRDSDNGYLGAPSANPATSSRGNYVIFESGRPRGEPDPPENPPPAPPPPCPLILLCPTSAAAARTSTEPDSEVERAAVPQLFVRYLGPK